MVRELLALAQLAGTDGDDLLVGSPLAETIVGGRGNDVIRDGLGGDTYLFNLGDGQDRIEALTAADGFGTIQFGAGIVTGDVTAKRDADGNLVLLIGSNGDRITLVDPASDPDGVAGTIRFANGATHSIAAIAASLAPTSDDDRIVASSPELNAGGGSGVNLFGLGGNDHIEGGAAMT